MSHTIINDLSIRYFFVQNQPKFLLRMETYESNCFPQNPKWGTRAIGDYQQLCLQISAIVHGIEAGHYRTKGNASSIGMLKKFQEAFNQAREFNTNSVAKLSVSSINDQRMVEIEAILRRILSDEELSLMKKQRRYCSDELVLEGPFSIIYSIAMKVKSVRELDNCFQIFHADDHVVYGSTPNPLLKDAESLRVRIDVPKLEAVKLKQREFGSNFFITNVDQNTFVSSNLSYQYFDHIFPVILATSTFNDAKKHLLEFTEFLSQLYSSEPLENYRFVLQGVIPKGHWYLKHSNVEPDVIQRVVIVDESSDKDMQMVNALSNLQLLGGIALPEKFPSAHQVSLF